MVTPELARLLAAGAKLPDLNRPSPFLKDAPTSAPSHPGPAVTGPAPMIWKRESLPIEELRSPTMTPAAASDSAAPGGPAAALAPSAAAMPPLPLSPNK